MWPKEFFLCAFVCWLTFNAAKSLTVTIGSRFSGATGPLPTRETVPINSTVEFKCQVNTTLLYGTFYTVTWNRDGVVVSTTNGVVRTSTITLTVTEENLSGVVIQCNVFTKPPLHHIYSGNATLITYGPPQTVSNLTTKPTTQSSNNALILSWNAPSSPVQLHYTVTMRLTNTNSTSTTTITMFNTSSTTITISRDNITGNSTLCDIYSFSVTAINPAGSSIPANHISPQSAPTNVQSDICVSSRSNCATVNYMAYSCTSIKYRIVVRNTCNDRNSSLSSIMANDSDDNSGSINIPYTVNCTNITIIAENSLGILEHTVNTTSPDHCTRPVQMCSLRVSSSQNQPTRSPMGSVPPSSSSSSITIASSCTVSAVVLIMALSLILVGVYICCKLKRKRGHKAIINSNQEAMSEL